MGLNFQVGKQGLERLNEELILEPRTWVLSLVFAASLRK